MVVRTADIVNAQVEPDHSRAARLVFVHSGRTAADRGLPGMGSGKMWRHPDVAHAWAVYPMALRHMVADLVGIAVCLIGAAGCAPGFQRAQVGLSPRWSGRCGSSGRQWPDHGSAPNNTGILSSLLLFLY